MSIQQMLLGASGASGYLMDKSLRFRASASAFLSRTTGTATNQNKWTWSGWVKRGSLGGSSVQVLMNGYVDDSNLGNFGFNGDALYMARLVGGSVATIRVTNAVFRDPSAWYHIVVVFDNANSTVADRVQIYVNGVLQTYSTSNDPGTTGMYINANSTAQRVGRSGSTASPFYFDGYLADVYFVDGQALTPASFGETNALTGVWQPKAYTGTYGTNGFYLDFETTTSVSALGTDKSGNGNKWPVNNVSLTAGVTYASLTDVPTLTSATAANYCTLNPLDSNRQPIVSDANLRIAYNGAAQGVIRGSIGVTSGKWYWESVITSSGVISSIAGVYRIDSPITTIFGANAYGYVYTGVKISNSSTAAYGASYTTGDIIGTAFDADNGTITFYKNNVSQGVAYTGLTGGEFFPAFSTNEGTVAMNFGQRPFAYTPPTGFVALNTFNLPTATILKGNTVMDVTTYTGNGTSISVTNTAGFKPDFVWVKSRASTFSHYLSDSVRGVGRAVFSNLVNAENVDTDQLTAFNSNGFSVGPNGGMNTSGNALVGAQWQAGQGTSSSNTSGSITSTVSVNATAGFSIVTYTGTGANATVGHGLGIAPSMIFIKQRNSSSTNWRVYSSVTGNTGATFLDLTNAFQVSSTYWNNTSPTSSVFSLGTNGDLNANGGTYIAYCWSQIEGFSKVGSYTGNASTDGTFVYLGFRPKYIMVKRTDSAENWYWWDSVRNPYNAVNADLYPNLTNAEDTSTIRCDFLSNGFKLRSSGSPNGSGGTFMYMAFAENPFKNSLAR